MLHDGKVAFPEAIEAVKELAGASKKVYILSNSSRRVATALQKISSLGFPAECFAGVTPSPMHEPGEPRCHALMNTPDPPAHTTCVERLRITPM